jgi:hypothetical protein
LPEHPHPRKLWHDLFQQGEEGVRAANVLQKPFMPDILTRRVRQAIECVKVTR